ncbi:uncharacterized protein LOC141652429 [Silene latifolia]|uniref:uncharacterized protein LOC141652429 n=1 Tax=Silene latifolia TaxID=37657 RepID=UPI003D786FFD
MHGIIAGLKGFYGDLRVMNIYTNYLWEGEESYHRAPPVSWQKVCKEKKYRGVGIRDCQVWNLAVIGKYTWWVSSKADYLWICWVNHVYIKKREWFDYQPTAQSSWTWRKICQVKERLKMGYVNGSWCTNNRIYTAEEGYKWLMQDEVKVNWYSVVWNRFNIPKHCVIGWLFALRRLLTKDILLQFGVISDGVYELCCAATEINEHLIFGCSYSQKCIKLLGDWLGCQIPWQGTLEWCRALRMKSLMQKQVIMAAIMALIYEIWMIRNRCRVELVVSLPCVVVKQVQAQIRCRANCKIWQFHHSINVAWCQKVGIM